MWIILFFKYGGEYFGPNYAPQFNSEAGKQGGEIPCRSAATHGARRQPDLGLPRNAGRADDGRLRPGHDVAGRFRRDARSQAVRRGRQPARSARPPKPRCSAAGRSASTTRRPTRRPRRSGRPILASREVQRDAPAPARISVLSDPSLVASRPHFPAVLEALSGKLALFPNVPQSAQIVTYMYEELNAALGGEKIGRSGDGRSAGFGRGVHRLARHSQLTGTGLLPIQSSATAPDRRRGG